MYGRCNSSSLYADIYLIPEIFRADVQSSGAGVPRERATGDLNKYAWRVPLAVLSETTLLLTLCYTWLVGCSPFHKHGDTRHH